MAVDMFLELDGGKIKGESQDATHKGKIDILAWSWGLSQSGSFHMGGGGGAGKADFQNMSLTKWVDASSTDLMLYCANGDHFEKGQLIVRKAGKTPLEYLVYDFKNILVTSVSTGGSGGEDRLTENVTINFAEVKASYKEQKPDGAAEAAKEFVWKIAENVQG